MVKGAFSAFKHEHHFSELNGITLMADFFDYKSPFGILGQIADKVFLRKYMTTLLTERNRIVKEYAESGRWKEVMGCVKT